MATAKELTDLSKAITDCTKVYANIDIGKMDKYTFTNYSSLKNTIDKLALGNGDFASAKIIDDKKGLKTIQKFAVVMDKYKTYFGKV